MVPLIAQVATILWVLAVILVIAGIVTLLRGGIVLGIVLIIVGLLVGPGGVSIFTD
ncbi:MAG: GPGG-motif small membrane protein [Actinomycetota bacterium]|nr:GPGG-motif small membrane protein [Actinomycetota bacterium]